MKKGKEKGGKLHKTGINLFVRGKNEFQKRGAGWKWSKCTIYIPEKYQKRSAKNTNKICVEKIHIYKNIFLSPHFLLLIHAEVDMEISLGPSLSLWRNQRNMISFFFFLWTLLLIVCMCICVYWVTQELTQICTVILRISIGNVAWFAVYIDGNFWVTQYVALYDELISSLWCTPLMSSYALLRICFCQYLKVERTERIRTLGALSCADFFWLGVKKDYSRSFKWTFGTPNIKMF